MNSKIKTQNALQHKETRIPVDFGATMCSGMHISVVEELRDYYGLDKHPVKAIEPYQCLGEIEEDLKQALGVDTEGIFPPDAMFGFPLKDNGWKEWKTPWDQVVLIPKAMQLTEDGNGDVYIYPQGDTSAPPSGKMPNTGYFFDAIIRQQQLQENDLDVADNTVEYKLIDQRVIDYYTKELTLTKQSGRAIVASMIGTAIGDISLVPGPQLKNPKGIRDVTEYYISILTRQDYLHEIFTYQTDIALKNLQSIAAALKNDIDVAFVCGTDFGTQRSTLISPETYKSLFHPYYKKMNDWIHHNTGWKTFKHCCGAVFDFMPLFIESGFDIINPVQLSAAGMDPRKLKKEFGKHLTFWGGGVDTQKTLPFGTPEEIRKEVLERCEILAPGGGFVFNSIHNIQAKTPAENVVAMIDAVKEFKGRQ